MVNNLPPLAGPVDASGEPERWALVLPESVKALEAKSLTTGRLLSDADCFQWVKAVDLAPCAVEHPVGPREYRCVNCRAVVSAAAVPSSPAQANEELLKSVEDFCGWWHLNRNSSVNHAYDTIDKVVKRWQRLLSALPSSSPVADGTTDDRSIYMRAKSLRIEDVLKHAGESELVKALRLFEMVAALQIENAQLKASAPSPSAGAAQESDIKKTTKL